ncbi:MAG: flagellar protein FlbB [Spirochaetales bacterium]|nr:MAG: flagellar protein FlbB [Spirochaetales bacterium]
MIGRGPRILLLLLLNVALVFGGLLVFDYLGLIDAKQTLSPVLSLFRIRRRTEVKDLGTDQLLEEQRYAKMEEALTLREEELDKRDQEITLQEAEIQQKLETLQEKEKSLEEREKSFNVQASLYDNKVANIEQNARYLTGMPPNSAVDILIKMEDQDIIDLMRATERLALAAGEDSIVAYWFSLMAAKDAERVAGLQRKMVKKPVTP